MARGAASPATSLPNRRAGTRPGLTLVLAGCYERPVDRGSATLGIEFGRNVSRIAQVAQRERSTVRAALLELGLRRKLE